MVAKKVTPDIEKKVDKKELGIVKDLALSPLLLSLGTVVGYATSYFFPNVLQLTIKDIRKKEIESLRAFAGHVGFFAGYSTGVYHIIENLYHHHDKPSAYIPIALNLIVGTGIAAYNHGKKKGLEQKVSE